MACDCHRREGNLSANESCMAQTHPAIDFFIVLEENLFAKFQQHNCNSKIFYHDIFASISLSEDSMITICTLSRIVNMSRQIV
jgi:hypothetical protein